MKKMLLIVGLALIAQIAFWGMMQKCAKNIFAWKHPSLGNIFTKDLKFYAKKC